MQTTRQEILRTARDERALNSRSLTEQALKSLREYRRTRFAERRLIAQKKAA